MDILYFIKILWQRKWMLMLVSLAAVILTYFLVGLLKPVYKSNAILATGITVRKNIKLSNEDPFVQKYEIVSAFSNLTTTMKSRTSLRLLSYRLLLHDLFPAENNSRPFRSIEPYPEYTITPPERDSFLRFLDQLRDSLWAVQLNQEQNAIFNQLTRAMDYDFESLEEHLNISRLEETDYLNVEFESENPELCEFAVNQFCQEFLKYHFQRVNQDEGEAVNFYRNLLQDKREQLNNIDRELNALKEANKIVNLEEQTRAMVGQLNDLEVAKEDNRKLIPGLRKTIGLLDGYLTDYADRSDAFASQMKIINEGLVNTVDQIKEIKVGELNDNIDEFVQKGGDADEIRPGKTKFEEAARDILIERFINQLKTNKINLDATLFEILAQRIQAEVDLALAEESVKSLDEKINELKQNSTNLITVEARINVLESQREMALQEYLQATTKLSDAKVIQQSSLYPLTFFEYAQVPEKPEPSKKLMSAAFAGTAAAGIFTFLLFLLVLFDNTLNSPQQFEKLITSPLLASLVRLPNRRLDYEKIFHAPKSRTTTRIYKEGLRKIRQKMEATGQKKFLFTSTSDNVDRSMTILSLAHSFSMKNQKVLIVDTNFKKNILSNFNNLFVDDNPLTNTEIPLPDRPLPNKLKHVKLQNTTIDVLGNQRSEESPSEVLKTEDFRLFLDQLATQYEYILMEAPGLNEYSDARELAPFADKVIAIFDARSVLKDTDKESLAYLGELEEKFLGCILQEVDQKNM